MSKRRSLGRGLSALIPDAAAVPGAGTGGREYFLCPIEEIRRAPDQPRQRFDETSLQELAESVRQQGIIQPLLVRADGGRGFILIAGERRWRAAQRAGLKRVPVVVKEASPAEAYELALVENLQRDDLNPIEEAEAYRRLAEELDYTQEQLAERVGKDRSTVANSLRLLRLPDQVRAWCASGELSMGHARALLGCDSEAAMLRLARKVSQRGLSVRQTEQLVRRQRATPRAAAPSPSASIRDLENRLMRALGTRVRVVQTSASAGRVEIRYASLDELDRVLERLLAS